MNENEFSSVSQYLYYRNGTETICQTAKITAVTDDELKRLKSEKCEMSEEIIMREE